jgi:inhibitor of KinA sporulation pathway (predicted exonuclease)
VRFRYQSRSVRKNFVNLACLETEEPDVAAAKRALAVVFDLEFTAWEGSLASRWSRPGEHTEIVQIGAVKLDAARLKVVDTFAILVRPRVNPVISDYLIALTGIGNEDLAQCGIDFVTAYLAFLNFVGEAPIWAFGRDDLILAANLKLYGFDRVLRVPPYRNVIPYLREQGIDLAGKHACDVAEAAGAAFEGRKHDALADAMGVAAGIAHLVARGAPNPFLAPGAA